MKDNTKLEIIKQYIVQGYHLIPLHYPTPNGCSCYKGETCPRGTQGKHPRESNWTFCQTHITTWEQALKTWGPEGNSSWNVGIVTGDCSGIVVIDVDGEAGKASLQKLIEDTGQDLTLTRTHKTGSGGTHLIFENPTDLHVTNSNKNLKKRYPGLDIRGNGGQIVACPSVSAKGDYGFVNQNPALQLGQSLLDVIFTPVNDTGKVSKTVHRDELLPRTELPTDVQEECDRYAESALQNELQRFTDEYDLDGWDDLVNAVAFNCFTLANSPWNALDVDDVYEIVYEKAPRGGDAEWTEHRIDKSIKSAYVSVVTGDKARSLPKKQEEALSQPSTHEMRKQGLAANIINWGEAFAFDYENVEFLPGGFVRQGEYITLIGDGKVGKSVFAHDWAWRMATGQEFLGKSMESPIPVLYLDAENAPQTFIDHFRSYGATPDTMGSLTFLSFPSIELDSAEGARAFVELVKDSGAKVVFIDTISRFIGGDENENNTWLKVYQRAIVPLREYDPNITVVRIDHFGKDKGRGGRGGSAKEQDVDTVYEMKKTNNGFVLERTHTRSGIGPETVAFFRTGRALEKMWAPGETRHELLPNWKVPKAVDRTSTDNMLTFLDEKCIPDGESGWGQRRTEQFLRDNHFSGTKEAIRKIQRERASREGYELVCPYDCELR